MSEYVNLAAAEAHNKLTTATEYGLTVDQFDHARALGMLSATTGNPGLARPSLDRQAEIRAMFPES
jgi:hypothetical protein